MLMPNAGRAGSAWMAEQLTARGITNRVATKVERVDAGRIVFGDGGEQPFDLLFAVPPHRLPDVAASGLTGSHGWIPVEPGTLATSHRRVYAIADVTLITLASGLPLPKAGVMAELQGLRVAQEISAEISEAEPPPPFDGKGCCPIELGAESAARRGRLVRDTGADRHHRRPERRPRRREGPVRARAPGTLVRRASRT